MGGIPLSAVRVLLAVQATQLPVASQASVSGTVRDLESNQPVAGAVVVLADLRATVTDWEGRYRFGEVPSGPHQISVRFIGYSVRTLQALVPDEGELEINVSLEPDPIQLKTLVVRPPVAIRGLEAAAGTLPPDRTISIAAIRNHPLLAEPDALQGLEGGEIALNPETPSGIHVHGGAADQTLYLIDGIPVYSPYHAAGVFSAWNPDALSRLELSSAAPSPQYSPALAGTLTAVTRAPGSRVSFQGSVSTTQTRLTVDGPLGVPRAGFLLSLRSDYPGVIAPGHENSYVRGATGDRLAKLELPAMGGQLRLLGYDNENEIDAAASGEDEPNPVARRNAFRWYSRSLGGEWRRVFSQATVRMSAWSTAADAGSLWSAQAAQIDLSAARRDDGLLAAVERRSSSGWSIAGLRVERTRTSYLLHTDSSGISGMALRATTPMATAFAERSEAIGPRLQLKVGSALTGARGNLHLDPRAQLRWRLSRQLALTGSYARLHQFAQSLRNAESVVGNVFPADLYVGAGAGGIPVARSDLEVIGAEYHPQENVQLHLQAYERAMDGIVLVAPREGGPFTTRDFVVGSGRSHGLSLEATGRTRHVGLVASYGLERVRLQYRDSSYIPQYSATHFLQGGMIVFPTASSSIRLGATAQLGRRTTLVSGGLEWEACNLLDRGCEFRGSPHYEGEALGATALPAYFRIDLGLRKDWNVAISGREASIGLFGTVTNLLGRRNVLTYARDPASGRLLAIEMRPLAPLVVGLDWRF